MQVVKKIIIHKLYDQNFTHSHGVHCLPLDFCLLVV